MTEKKETLRRARRGQGLPHEREREREGWGVGGQTEQEATSLKEQAM